MVIPVHKKGDKTNINNYRPISLLSSFSKIIEKIMLSRLTSFLQSHNILNDCQHGFQKHKSTLTAIFNFTNTLYNALDKGEQAIGLFYDLSKAFDTIDHNLLLSKLFSQGIRGTAQMWIASFLTQRTQVVRINSLLPDIPSSTSSPQIITQGVPQGSVLSLLLFLLYVNDLPQLINTGHLFQFADDTNHLLTAPRMNSNISLIQTANEQTAIISSYCLNNKLAIQPSKSVFINFHTKNNPPSSSPLIRIDNRIIPSAPSTKFLGIHITPDLDWSLHIQKILSKIKGGCFLLRRLKPIVNPNILKLVYHAHLHSHLSYGLLFWGSSPQSKRIFKVQKQAIRIISGISRRKTCKPHFIEHNILTLTCSLIQIASTLVRSHPELFPLNSSTHTHQTRGRNDLRIPSHNHSFFTHSPIHLCTKIYNNLPQSITHTSTRKAFDTALRKYLIQNPYYTLKDFLPSF